MSLLNREDLKTAHENRAIIEFVNMEDVTLHIENKIVESIEKAVKLKKFTTDILFTPQILHIDTTNRIFCDTMDRILDIIIKDLRTLGYEATFEFTPELIEKIPGGEVIPSTFKLHISW